MAAKLNRVSLALCVLLLTACTAPWAGPAATSTVVVAVSPSPSVSSSPERTAETASPPTEAPATTVSATPMATSLPVTPFSSTPVVQAGKVARCCGVFSWLDATHLLVFDTPNGGKSGAWLVDVSSGKRQLVAPTFGIPSESGLIAFPDSVRGVTEIRKPDGTLVTSIQNGGALTWVSPDGQHAAWLAPTQVPDSSSLVSRVTRLTTANLDGSNARSVLEFKASAIQWQPDNVHVLAVARDTSGAHSGIWSIDAADGTNGVVVPATYIQALNVSPDGTRMAYLVTFSGDTSKDGVWVANNDGSHAVHLKEVGAFRWAGDSWHLWFLRLAGPGGGDDHLDKIDVATDSILETVDLGGRVLNDQWQVNQMGDIAAYWNEADKSVVVKPLKR